ncbi:MAG: hypothetical protein RLZZ200_1377 [Pseudomonadota bacterium]|jgi:hydroxyethylthiazole kinase
MVWDGIETVRARSPIVMNITNYVVMNNTANALLAIGASPVMAHALDEVEELVGISSALVLNIGTLSGPWIEAMLLAGNAARSRGVPVVLDPVGAGASAFRTSTARRLVETVRPAIIRGNASEIRAVLRAVGGTHGVDSSASVDEVADDAQELARSAACVVSVSGQVDLITDGTRVDRISNGSPLMPRVTGMGCTATAVTGAFAGAGLAPLEAATLAMATMGVAGDIAGERARGPGSFQMEFLDALHGLSSADVAARLRMQRI